MSRTGTIRTASVAFTLLVFAGLSARSAGECA
jgi:hypothetical protein